MILSKLRALREKLLGTLWFVPSMVVVGFLILAVVMVKLSSHVDRAALIRWPLLFGANAESSRSILAAVASGMITVAGLTFSLTLLAVTQASSQFTPRILRNFMGDRANQLMLGTFVGVFAYCIVVLRTIRGSDNNSFVPSLATVLGMLLGIGGLGVLIIAVHHIASSLQATTIIARVARETEETIDKLYPHRLDEELSHSLEGDREDFRAAEREVEAWHAVPSPKSGYIQTLDAETLVDRAAESGRLLRVQCCPGAFVVEGAALASLSISNAERMTSIAELQAASRRIESTFTIGQYRTLEQDPGFGIRQLVDIALKALSPGINDTTTAISCLHYLGAILIRLASRKIDEPVARQDGTIRVLACGPSFQSLLSLAFDQIRQSAAGNIAVLELMIRTSATIAQETSDSERREAAVGQLLLLHENAQRTVPAPHDRNGLGALYRESLRSCNSSAS